MTRKPKSDMPSRGVERKAKAKAKAKKAAHDTAPTYDARVSANPPAPSSKTTEAPRAAR